MNQTNEHPSPTGPTRVAPQVVHVVAKPGGLSTALLFIFGLFAFAAVFVVGLTVGLIMMFGFSNIQIVILEELYRDGGSSTVAVIPVEGIIEPGQSAFVHNAVEYVLKQSDIRAVVLRVDSPGGGSPVHYDGIH